MANKGQEKTVNLHHTMVFLASEKAATEEEVEDEEKEKEPRNVKDMLDNLLNRPSVMPWNPDYEPDEPEALANRFWDFITVNDEELTLDDNLELKVEEVHPPWRWRMWRKDPYEDIHDLLVPGLEPPPLLAVPQYELSSDDYSTESDEPKRKSWKFPKRLRHPNVNMYSKDYWLARKKVKNLRVGNGLAVITTLNFMAEMDFKNQDLLYGIADSGGLETITNILDSKGLATKLNALKLINKMADYEIIKGMMVNQGIADSCFKLLCGQRSDLSLAASKIVLKLCELTCMRSYCRQSKGLEILLEYADMKNNKWLLNKKPPQLTGKNSDLYETSVNCLTALSLLFGSKTVRKELYRLGFMGLLKRLVLSENPTFSSMAIRMITRAASINEYVEVFIEEGLLDFVYKKYTSNEPEVHLDMLKVVYKCLNNQKCKKWMLEHGLYMFLVDEFRKRANKELKYTMACIVKFANIEKYRKIFDNSNPIMKLFQLFEHPSPKIRDYAGYLLGQMSRYPKNFGEIAGGQNIGVMKLLQYVQENTDYNLVAHAYKVICDLSFDDRIYWDICDATDPIRILWGAVTADHPKINEYGCSALVPYIGPMPDSLERVFRFPGALADLLNLTYHEDDGAKAGAVTLLARFCQFNLLFKPLIEEGFDKRLLELAKTATHPRLRYAIGYGFGSCARTDRMSFSLGKRGAVTVLLEWLVNDDDKYAQLGIVTGLWKLSFEPINCKTIIQAKVVERLTYLTVGKNECLQNSVAGLLSNMRYLARSAESLRNRQRPHPPEPYRGLASDPDIIHPYQYADDLDDTPL